MIREKEVLHKSKDSGYVTLIGGMDDRDIMLLSIRLCATAISSCNGSDDDLRVRLGWFYQGHRAGVLC
jgi:hypothetical protein